MPAVLTKHDPVSRRMDLRITIQRDATVVGSLGGKTKWTTPAELCTVWAELSYFKDKGREEVGDFPVSAQTTQFLIDRRTDVLVDMRVVLTEGDQTRYFEIRTIKRGSSRDQTMVLECEEVL